MIDCVVLVTLIVVQALNALKVYAEKLTERDCYKQDLEVCGRIILKRILKKRDGKIWTGFI
jgi:hypothetical protein